MPREHPLVREAMNHSENAEVTLERIRCITKPLAYKVRFSRWRGAVWLDREERILWLLAAEHREDGADDDAYEYFEDLYQAGTLFPTAEDYLRDAAEAIIRFRRAATSDVRAALEAARLNPGEDVEIDVVCTLPTTIAAVSEDGELEEMWVRVSCRAVDGVFVTRELANTVLALFEEQAGPGVWEHVYEWRDGSVMEFYYVARYGVTDRRGYA